MCVCMCDVRVSVLGFRVLGVCFLNRLLVGQTLDDHNFLLDDPIGAHDIRLESSSRGKVFLPVHRGHIRPFSWSFRQFNIFTYFFQYCRIFISLCDFPFLQKKIPRPYFGLSYF